MGRVGVSRPDGIVPRWNVFILVVLWFNLILPVIDATALERDPWHDHLVFGATGPRAEEVLRSHRHSFERPLELPCPACGPGDEVARDGGTADEGVVVVPGDEVAGSVLGHFGKMLYVSGAEVNLPRALPHVSPVGDLPVFEGIVLPLLDPPPRAFSSTTV